MGRYIQTTTLFFLSLGLLGRYVSEAQVIDLTDQNHGPPETRPLTIDATCGCVDELEALLRRITALEDRLESLSLGEFQRFQLQ